MLLNLLEFPPFLEPKVIKNDRGTKYQYLFYVHPKMTKTEIKKFIEKIFSIKVLAINTNRPPQKKNFSNRKLKLAYITVKCRIALFEIERTMKKK